MDIGNEMLESMGEAVEPAQTQEVAPQPEPAPQPVAQPTPSLDPSLFIGALENIHSRMDEISRPSPAPQPDPSEEELIMQQLADKMGLGAVKQENQQLKQMLEEMKGQSSQMQEFIQKQQIDAHQAEILSKYEGISKDMVYGKLNEIAQQYGMNVAESLNNTEGWNYIISTQLQRPPSKPDPIVATNSSGDDFLDNATQRVKSGTPQDGDIGDLFLSYLS